MDITKLEITKYFPLILGSARENPMTIVSAHTGSGKSLGIPRLFAKGENRVMVAVPTVLGVRDLFNKQKLFSPPIKVGTAAEGDVNYEDGDDNLIIYATSGHIRRRMIEFFRGGVARPINFCDVLIIDEAHIGSADNDIIINLWKFAQKRKVAVPPLILMSATMGTGMSEGVKPIEIKLSRTYPIDVKYSEKDYSFTNTEKLYQDTVQTLMTAFEHHEGDALIFVAGKRDVEKILELIRSSNKQIVALPAYSALSREEQDKINKPVTSGFRKVVVATNIAETTITINDLGIVIDTMLEKVATTSRQTGGIKLETVYESKSSADQRKGRTGRTRPGICFRMISEDSYNKLSSNRLPEIERIPIYEIILELLDVQLQPQDVIIGISPARLNSSLSLLNKLGFIDDENRVTASGKFAPTVPLSVRAAAVVYEWSVIRKLPPFPAIVAMSLYDTYGPYFFIPRKEEREDETEYNDKILTMKDKIKEKYGASSDLEVHLKMWSVLMKKLGGPNAGFREISRKCQDMDLNARRIKDLLKIVTMVSRQFENIEVGPFSSEKLVKSILPILENVFNDRKMTLIENEKYRDVDGVVFIYDKRDSFSTIADDLPSNLLGLLNIELGNRKFVNFAIPVLTTEKEKPKQIISAQKKKELIGLLSGL